MFIGNADIADRPCKCPWPVRLRPDVRCADLSHGSAVPGFHEALGFLIERLAPHAHALVVAEPRGEHRLRAAVRRLRHGARRGVGIDIDPERVTESRANVRNAGLENRIEIRLGDALDIKDLSSASVVFLYMGDHFNMLIRPLLWKALPVGARVVSHRFEMGDWKPDKTVRVPGIDGIGYELHLWTITPEVKRYQEIKAGVIVSSIGIALAIFLFIFMQGVGGHVSPEDREIISRLWVAGIIPFMVGLALIVAIGGVAQNARRAASAWLESVVPGDVVVTSIRPIGLDEFTLERAEVVVYRSKPEQGTS